MAHAITPIAGFSDSLRTAEPLVALGTVVLGDADTIWLYGQASETVAVGTCTISDTTFLITDAAGLHTADVAFAANDYGWVRQTIAVSPGA